MNTIVALLTNSDEFDHMGDFGGGWMWLWGTAMMVLFVLLIVWLVRATAGQGGGTGPQSSSSRARAILDERYAKGDLSTEEYRERSGELE